jgi:hypothetical protein
MSNMMFRRIPRSIFVVSMLLSVFSFSNVWAQRESQPHSVCEVIESRIALNGKTIVVKGILDPGSHWLLLYPERPVAPATACSLGSPIILDIPYKLDPGGLEIYSEETANVGRQIDALLKAVEKSQGTNPSTQLLVTLVGTVETIEDFMLHKEGERTYGNGFAESGRSPVMLWIKEIKEATLRPKVR